MQWKVHSLANVIRGSLHTLRVDDRARGHLMKLYILIIIGHTLKEVTCLIVWHGTRIKRKLNKKQKQKQNLQLSERSLILEYSFLV